MFLMDRVDVSVIIAAYNVERYIERAVSSALSQDDVRVEVIVVDDCSTDRTRNIVATIDDARLSCIALSRNGGPGAARNAGFARAAGTWIAILDGDDAFAPGRLARCLRRAEEAKADIVVDNLMVMRESDGVEFPMFPPSRLPRSGFLDLAGFISGNSSFFQSYTSGYLKPLFLAEFTRKHCLSYDPDIRIGEDYFFLADHLACGAVCAMEPSAGYLYTARAGSTSHRLVPEDMIRISDCDKKFLSRHRLDKAAVKAQRRRNFGIEEARAFTVLVQGLKQRNIIEVVRALMINPSCICRLRDPIRAKVEKFLKTKSSER
jgi:succinoglycan biosynthesis protein ExoO